MSKFAIFGAVVVSLFMQPVAARNGGYFEPDGGVISTVGDLTERCNAEPQSQSWWICASYILGAFRAHMLSAWLDGEDRPFCLPLRFSDADIIDRVIANLNERTSQIEDPEGGAKIGAALILRLVLVREFPCRKAAD